MSSAIVTAVDQKLTSLVIQSISDQGKRSEKHEALVAELRFLERFLFEKLLEFDISTLLYPKFQGIVFESKTSPVRHLVDSAKYTTFLYHLWLERYTKSVRAANIESYADKEHYRSLHIIKSPNAKPEQDLTYDIIQIRYAVVQDRADPYNTGKNSQVVAYSERDIHFLIQILHSLLLEHNFDTMKEWQHSKEEILGPKSNRAKE